MQIQQNKEKDKLLQANELNEKIAQMRNRKNSGGGGSSNQHGFWDTLKEQFNYNRELYKTFQTSNSWDGGIIGPFRLVKKSQKSLVLSAQHRQALDKIENGLYVNELVKRYYDNKVEKKREYYTQNINKVQSLIQSNVFPEKIKQNINTDITAVTSILGHWDDSNEEKNNTTIGVYFTNIINIIATYNDEIFLECKRAMDQIISQSQNKKILYKVDWMRVSIGILLFVTGSFIFAIPLYIFIKNKKIKQEYKEKKAEIETQNDEIAKQNAEIAKQNSIATALNEGKNPGDINTGYNHILLATDENGNVYKAIKTEDGSCYINKDGTLVPVDQNEYSFKGYIQNNENGEIFPEPPSNVEIEELIKKAENGDPDAIKQLQILEQQYPSVPQNPTASLITTNPVDQVITDSKGETTNISYTVEDGQIKSIMTTTYPDGTTKIVERTVQEDGFIKNFTRNVESVENPANQTIPNPDGSKTTISYTVKDGQVLQTTQIDKTTTKVNPESQTTDSTDGSKTTISYTVKDGQVLQTTQIDKTTTEINPASQVITGSQGETTTIRYYKDSNGKIVYEINTVNPEGSKVTNSIYTVNEKGEIQQSTNSAEISSYLTNEQRSDINAATDGYFVYNEELFSTDLNEDLSNLDRNQRYYISGDADYINNIMNNGEQNLNFRPRNFVFNIDGQVVNGNDVAVLYNAGLLGNVDLNNVTSNGGRLNINFNNQTDLNATLASMTPEQRTALQNNENITLSINGQVYPNDAIINAYNANLNNTQFAIAPDGTVYPVMTAENRNDDISLSNVLIYNKQTGTYAPVESYDLAKDYLKEDGTIDITKLTNYVSSNSTNDNDKNNIMIAAFQTEGPDNKDLRQLLSSSEFSQDDIKTIQTAMPNKTGAGAAAVGGEQPFKQYSGEPLGSDQKPVFSSAENTDVNTDIPVVQSNEIPIQPLIETKDKPEYHPIDQYYNWLTVPISTFGVAGVILNCGNNQSNKEKQNQANLNRIKSLTIKQIPDINWKDKMPPILPLDNIVNDQKQILNDKTQILDNQKKPNRNIYDNNTIYTHNGNRSHTVRSEDISLITQNNKKIENLLYKDDKSILSDSNHSI